MNIWILTSETPHYWAGGIARYVDNFAKLAGAAGNRVTVISRGEKRGFTEISTGYRLYEFPHRYDALREVSSDPEPDAHPAWPFNNMAYFAALGYQYLKELEALLTSEGAPDIIECQEYGALGYFILQKKLTAPDFLNNVPILVHLHTPDFAVQSVNQYPRHKLPDYWIGRMERATIRLADALLSPSRFIAEELDQMLGGLPSIETIPYPWSADIATAEVYPGNCGKLLYAGRIELRKGVEPLLAAAEELWREGHAFTLELVGGDVETPLKGGSLEAYLKKRYKRRLQEGKLIFHGAQSHAQCLRLMQEAGAVLVPSLWENYPNTCIEAMTLGKVVLASAQGGQAEMVGLDGRAGVVFDHRESGSLKAGLRQVLELDRPTRLKMGNIAKDRIGQFCQADRILEKRLAHYAHVIDSHIPKNRYPFNNKRLRDSVSVQPLSNDPMVSVVVPYYNLGKYVSEALNSIYTSKGVRYEVIVVNDGSTDPHSLSILSEWESRGLDNFRVLHISNGGLANARNVGAETAQGELVAFVDADDRIGPDFLSRATGVLQRFDNVHLVYSWVRFFDGGYGIWHSWTFDLPYLLCHNQLVPLAVVRRDSFLQYGRNKSHIVYGLEDFEGWISLAEAGCGGVAIAEPLVEYRIREDSMFKVIENDKKLYLYDLISHEHPQLYSDYGMELFNLQNANGPAHGWDQPTMFRAPQDRLLTQMAIKEKRLKLLEDENRRLKDAEIWHKGELNRLQSEVQQRR
jgi:glycosyltransferase involved in cell wall biosynthesis